MNGYKGFDKNMKCLGFQFEIGKTFEHKGEVSLCKSGFHFCENPLDVLKYYGPATSVYAEVEGDGDGPESNKKDTKVVVKKLTITASISLRAMILAGVSSFIKKAKAEAKPTSGYSSPAATSGNSSPAATSGDYSHAATSGNSSHAATSGYSSHAATSGDYSHAATKGKNSIAAAIGRDSRAKGTIGNWIVLAEYDDDGNVLMVKTANVDGDKIKDDVFYTLKGGEFVEVKE